MYVMWCHPRSSAALGWILDCREVFKGHTARPALAYRHRSWSEGLKSEEKILEKVLPLVSDLANSEGLYR
uniref:Uncharacterized protein n=1 Tax=Brevibacterium sp. Ap13 TaxID=1406197 RepID=U5NZA7_9MICO|nr:hypothetical protein AP13_p00700 [Brevibacterium sp. Ap13]